MLNESEKPLQKEKKETSYNQILKATSIIGGSSVVSIILRIIRTKVMAVYLGPSGIGILGIYNSITSIVAMLAGMGIANSGVRQIAEVFGTDDKVKIARSTIILRRTSWVLGFVGTMLLLVAAKPISVLTFGDTAYVGTLAILSITILLDVVASSQSALVQGMRRIGDLAKINILGALWGTFLCIPIIYIFREDGIVLFLLILSFTTIMSSWWYARRIKVLKVELNWAEIVTEARVFLGLGLAFMASGLMSAAVAYFIRVFIVRHLDIEAAGQYQAAWALSGIYVGFILGAMGTDYYPRLTAVAKDNSACNRLVNEQAEVSLLLGVPGILATIIFAPLVIRFFYSGAFDPAIDLVRWQMLGILLKLAAFPIGFIILAKGAAKLFMLTETLTYLAYMVSSWFCLKWFGLVGAGVAFFVMYLFNWLIVWIVVRRSFGYTWSNASCRLAASIAPAICISFLIPFWLPELWSMIIGGFITVLVGLLCMQRLFKLIDCSRLPVPLNAMARWLRH
jgi:enterobacterial common antigen flippase